MHLSQGVKKEVLVSSMTMSSFLTILGIIIIVSAIFVLFCCVLVTGFSLNPKVLSLTLATVATRCLHSFEVTVQPWCQISTVSVLMGPALVSDQHSVSTHWSSLGVR